jgi:ABC-2 type transport system ATP-binding protein
MGALLVIEGLRYAYGDRVAVDDLSLEVQRGEVLGLLGPNGAGKTTAISCLGGLLAPSAGRLRFDGRPFEPRRNPADRAHLGVVPQELALYGNLTAAENLTLFAKLHGVPDVAAAVTRGLALSGLAERGQDRVKTFSGGMKRRLNLAVAMLGEPLLALLDEPMVGVDPQSRHHILASIEQLRRDDRALIYTSHSMDEVQRLCDRVAILDRGRLVDCGTADQLATRAGVPGADLETTFLELTGHSLRDGAP